MTARNTSTDDTVAIPAVEGELIMTDDARLFDSQHRRALAVGTASESLRGLGNVRVDAMEVMAVAAWIIDGGDPWARKTGEA